MEISFPLPSEFWIKVCVTTPGRFGPLSHGSSRALINERYLCVFGPISITSSLGMGGESHLSIHPLPRAYHNSFLITWPPKSRTGRAYMGIHAHGIHSTLIYVNVCVSQHIAEVRGQLCGGWSQVISLPPPCASPRDQTQVSLVPREPFWLRDLTGLWILIHDFKL